ncbi:MAG: hypothetical protein HYR74_06820 [Candidatus Eisenbacteria bacterium]|nr:hypothetical protein [Candidatus Eisenbacteria bacterium]
MTHGDGQGTEQRPGLGSDPRGERLTLAECRRLLPPDFEIDDQQLEQLRGQLYVLAEVVLDEGGRLLPRLDQGTGRKPESPDPAA